MVRHVQKGIDGFAPSIENHGKDDFARIFLAHHGNFGIETETQEQVVRELPPYITERDAEESVEDGGRLYVLPREFEISRADGVRQHGGLGTGNAPDERIRHFYEHGYEGHGGDGTGSEELADEGQGDDVEKSLENQGGRHGRAESENTRRFEIESGEN